MTDRPEGPEQKMPEQMALPTREYGQWWDVHAPAWASVVVGLTIMVFAGLIVAVFIWGLCAQFATGGRP